MPTERLKRLPAGKKEAIRNAAIQEFARVPFEKASINQIIQAADISRGSFYTYFEDKQDVIHWLFEDSGERIRKISEETLEKTDGDYFAVMGAVFEYMLDFSQDTKELIEVAKNVFSNQSNIQMIGFDSMPSPKEYAKGDCSLRKIYEKIDKTHFRMDSIENFCPLAALGAMAILFSIRQYYEYPDELENIREFFLNMLDLLRYGALKI